MAVAVYATDLTDLYTDAQGTWSLISSGGGGQNSLTDPETDDYIQGANSVSRNPFSSSIRGMVNTIGATTVATDDAVWMWVKADVAQALDTKAGGGIQCLIGSGTGALECYYVAGSDTYAFGGWRCYPIDPTLTGDTQIGTPAGTYSVFGVRYDVPATGPSKGFPFKADAIRHGRYAEVTGGTAPDPDATFQGLADFQGALTRQWGQFQENNGTFLMQGGLRLGTTATAVNFTDANRAIFISNTEYVASTFNRIEVNNTSSVVDISNTTITSLGTTSRGDFEMVDSGTITLSSCTFTDLGTFIFDATTNTNTITNTTFRRCDLVTAGGATFDGCVFDNCRTATSLSIADLDDVTNSTFISDGSNHAIDLGTISTTVAMGWNNTLTGYAGADGATGNEAIAVTINSPNVLTINVAAGATRPYIDKTGTGTVTVVEGQVTLNVTVLDITNSLPLLGARVYVTEDSDGGAAIIDKVLTDSDGLATDTRSYSADQPIVGKVRSASGLIKYKPSRIVGTVDAAAGLNVTVQMIRDE